MRWPGLLHERERLRDQARNAEQLRGWPTVRVLTRRSRVRRRQVHVRLGREGFAGSLLQEALADDFVRGRVGTPALDFDEGAHILPQRHRDGFIRVPYETTYYHEPSGALPLV